MELILKYVRECNGIPRNYQNNGQKQNSDSIFGTYLSIVDLFDLFLPPQFIQILLSTGKKSLKFQENRVKDDFLKSQLIYVEESINTGDETFLQSPTAELNVIPNHLDMFTLLQSEDPIWFLMRSFLVTSRTSDNFIAVIMRDFESNMDALTSLLASPSLENATTSFSPSETSTRELLLPNWKLLSDVIGMQRREANETNDATNYVAKLINFETQLSDQYTKQRLQHLFVQFNISIPTSWVKSRMVNKVLETKEAFERGDITAPDAPKEDPQERSNRKVRNLNQGVAKAALNSWIMKPLVKTGGTTEGSVNKIQVLKGLPNFLRGRDVIYKCQNTTGDTIQYSYAPRKEDHCSSNKNCGFIEKQG